jgi:dihydrofolate synthase/folylpolyglutamate synthase
MTYPDSVRFLYALGNEIKTAKLGLDRIRAVLAALGNPQQAFRIVHVAGTNGKGSTCAMIEAGLRASGRRTGLFTSPHLIEPTERIQIDGDPVTPREFQRAFEVVHRSAEALDLDTHPTYFETVTAMAFWLFRERRADTAVVEVGLGGRLDATNVVDPVLTVITPIDFDHEEYLGHSIEAIAAEKAGILKPGVPAVFAHQRPEAASVLEARAAELGVSVTRAADYAIRDLIMDARGSRFVLTQRSPVDGSHAAGAEQLIPPALELVSPLPGEHQAENAVTAALSLQILGVRPEIIKTGIGEARWPGRLEVVAPNPDILLDGAHNPAGARALARYLQRFYADRKLWMIYGAMRDKAIEEVAGILFPLADELIFTAAQSSRALRPEALAKLAGRGQTAASAAEALALARVQVSAEDAVVITGSLFLVGEARQLFVEELVERRWS